MDYNYTAEEIEPLLTEAAVEAGYDEDDFISIRLTETNNRNSPVTVSLFDKANVTVRRIRVIRQGRPLTIEGTRTFTGSIVEINIDRNGIVYAMSIVTDPDSTGKQAKYDFLISDISFIDRIINVQQNLNSRLNNENMNIYGGFNKPVKKTTKKSVKKTTKKPVKKTAKKPAKKTTKKVSKKH